MATATTPQTTPQTTTTTTTRWVAPLASTPAELAVTLKPAADILAHDGVVAFPTETVYGLGGNALSDVAVQKIFAAKGRPGDNPLIVHVSSPSMVQLVASRMTPSAVKLTERFWPGPLTVVVPSNDKVSKYCTAGQTTVGLRMPDHAVARALIELAGVPIAAPSANKSGKPSPTSADHVLRDLGDTIPGVVDSGPCSVGLESTVVDCSGPDDDTVTILRPGGITHEQLCTVIPNVLLDPALEKTHVIAPKAPGMKYTHYAPKAPVRLVPGTTDHFIQVIQKLKQQPQPQPQPHQPSQEQPQLQEQQPKHQVVGVMCTSETAPALTPHADVVFICGSQADLPAVARELFSTLRKFDDTPVTVILAESFPSTDIGLAIMNRLSKSAGHMQVVTLDDI